MAPCAVKQIGEDAYPSGLAVIAVNIDVRLPARRFAGTGIKNFHVTREVEYCGKAAVAGAFYSRVT